MGDDRASGAAGRPAHTHQMPTSLLLLSIQVSAASNLAEELLVTFCGRGREEISPPSGRSSWSDIILLLD